MSLDPFDEPLRVEVVDGEVVVLGPDGLNASMTPQAAEESGRRLIAAARAAHGAAGGAEEGEPTPPPLRR